MSWYGKYDEESREEKLERRIKELERKEKRHERDDNFSMTSHYYHFDEDEGGPT